MSVTINSKRLDKMQARMRSASVLVTRVGIYGAKAEAPEEGGDLTVGEVARFHEFGRGHNPERSFLRGTVWDKSSEIKALIRRAAKLVADGKMTQRQALDLVGLKIAGMMRQRIAAGIPPPLAASTLRQKGEGKTTPLIRTGQLRNSIDHEVVEGAHR